MANRRSRKIRKIRKSHAWVAVLLFLIVHALAGSLIVAFVEIFAEFLIHTKSESELADISYMARIYDMAAETGNTDDIYKLLDESERNYFVRDNEGNIIHEFGKNTAGDKGSRIVTDITTVYNETVTGADYENDENAAKSDVNIDFNVSRVDSSDNGVKFNINTPLVSDNMEIEYTYSDKVTFYEDLVYNYVCTDDEGEVTVRFKSLYDNVLKLPVDDLDINEDMSEEEVQALIDQKMKESDEKNSEIFNLNMKSTVHLPYWIGIKVNDGNEEFVGKAYINLAMTDLGFFLIFVVMLCLLAFLMFVIMLVYMISSFVSQKKTTKLLFTDIVTSGHNWMWFLYKGEQALRKWSTARNNYAVVNFVFVKYRNYCVCHSIEQGEKMLKRVYDHINKRLEKKEMIAHVSNSNFALILKYDDPDKLKMRLQSLILELEKIDSDHVFSFQAGVDPVGIWKNDKGRVIRRKYIDLEKEYNNACTARATLSDKDESGVAFFDDKLVEDQKWIDKVTERQRYAIEHEEFIVYYQPKYDPSTDKLRGAEALIRWQNDEMGFVPPGRFIPIFEKSGFITEIDHYMLEHVARDQKAWLDKGYECVPVSVNVSRAHFIESDLAEQIRDIVDRAGTPHKYIEIELTESAFFDDKNALISTITRLKEYGFSVSMDDFGSGYSSLNSLKDMPLDVLKLDAEFFRGDSHGEREEIVVSEAIKLAKSLNMKTVAEGVEIKEQVDFLAEQGCDMIQGYYYAKPMPKDEYEQRMKG